MSTPKLIKRYTNRKLYDTTQSRYVTLEDLAGMIRAGDEIRVMDNKSGDDLTNVTLAQIIFETEKKKGFMPVDLLRGLIQEKSEALTAMARQGAERVSLKAVEFKEAASKLRSDVQERVQRVVHNADSDEAKELLNELLERSQTAFDDLQQGLEVYVKGSVEGAKHRYTQLGQDVEEIRHRLRSVTSRFTHKDTTPPPAA